MLCEKKWECGWLWIRRLSDRRWRQANDREVIAWLAGQVEALESRLAAIDGGVKQPRYDQQYVNESMSRHGESPRL